MSPVWLFASLWRNRELIWQMSKREVVGRYSGSVMGLAWSFLSPMLMLAVYTFVFSVVFKARWTGGSDSKVEFALVLFVGLIFYNLFSECVNRAPSLIVGNANYVKKVVFPLEILPIVTLCSALFHMAINFVVWIVFFLIFFGAPPITVFLLVVIMLPLAIFTVGVSWFLASLGVFLRDVAQVVGIVTAVLLFLSPIFYPSQAMPVYFRNYMQFSPLTLPVEQARNVVMWAKGMEWAPWTVSLVVAVFVAFLGFAWFQKTRKGFADVI